MSDPLVTSDDPVIFLGGGEFAPELLAEALTIGGEIVAADGGAARALAAGRVPRAVIGDLDSLAESDRAAIPAERIHRIAEQTSTDFEKCLIHTSAPLALAVGFTGARMDHALAVMNALVAHPEKRCIVLGTHDLAFHAAGELEMDLPAGTRLSLFPMRRVTLQQTGLLWPVQGLVFEPWGRIGTSNEALGGPVRLSFDAPGMLVILPRGTLGAAVSALLPGRPLAREEVDA